MTSAPAVADTTAAALTTRLSERLTEPSAEAARRRVLDTLGALAAGLRVPGAELLPAAGDGDPAGQVRRLCAIVRSTEVDDIDHISCTTPGSVAVPVALALGAGLDVCADNLLAAVAAGYEAMTAIGDAVDGPRALYRGIWPSYLAAPVAAAATAARVLELDEVQTIDALSIAAARVTGVAGRAAREPTARWFLYGCAAADGVSAALAAERGFAGDLRVLDGLVAGSLQRADGDRPPAVTRLDVKPFCTARQTQPAIEAAVLARTELDRDVPLDSIEVRVPEAYRAMIDQPHPADRLASIMSAQFQIAAALCDEATLYDVVRRTPALSEEGAALAALVSVRADAQLDALYPEHWAAIVVLRARDGREVARRVVEPDGSPAWDPAWDWLAAKHERLGGLGARLTPVLDICRGLGGARRGDARALLEMTLSSIDPKEKPR